MDASAGTFVGAALQTAGQYYQSYALDLLSSPLEGLVVLAFVIGVVGVLTAVALQGGMRAGLLLLLGPALFLVAVYQRSPVPTVKWRDALTAKGQESVGEAAATLAPEKAYKPRTSSLFSAYDRLVSGFVGQTSEALRSTDAKMDIGGVIRTQLLGFMMSPQITDPGLKEILHLSLLGECRAMIRAGQEMADFRNRPAERCEWARSYSTLAGNTAFRLTPNASKYIASVDVDHINFFATPVVDDLNEELAKLKTQLANLKPPEQKIDCDVSGTQNGPGRKGDASQLAEAAVLTNASIRNRILQMVGGTTNGPRTSDSVESLSSYFDDRDAKINARLQELSSESFSCHELWNISYLALHYEAAMALESVKKEGEAKGFDQAALIAELEELTGVEGTRELIRTISRKLFRLEYARGSASAIVEEYARTPEVRNIEVSDLEGIQAKIKQETLESEWTGQASLIQTAMMLPYYQGLILFFLSISFPFFAILLAIPGRAFGFGFWFGLWFWVKSWDIGYALVSMVDRVLYSLFVVRLDNGYAENRKMLDLDFSSALVSLREVDPTFDVGTYYNIMGICLMAVPVVTAQMTVQVASTLANIVRGQIRLAQSNATRTAAKLYDQRALGAGSYGDITAKALDDAATLIPRTLPRATSVTVIDEPAMVDPAVLPERTPNLISTAGQRSPSVLPNAGVRGALPPGTRGQGASRGHPYDQSRSRWEFIDNGDLPELIEGSDVPSDLNGEEPKALDRGLDSNGLPRLPGNRS